MGSMPNLLPVALLRARSHRSRLRQWIAVVTLECLLAVFAALMLRFDYDNPAEQARDAIDSTVSQIDVVNAQLAVAQAELQAVQQQLAVAHEVASHPNWAIVLTAVARSGLGLVELDSTQLMPPTTLTDDTGSRYRLSLVGSAASRPDVTQFVTALESCGFFSRVRIGQTQQIKGPGKDQAARVSFGIEAWMIEGAE